MNLNHLFVGLPAACAEYEYIHGTQGSRCTAFELNERAGFRIFIPRALGVFYAAIDLFSEALEYIKSIPLEWKGIKRADDVYEARLPIKELSRGLYFFRPRVSVFDRVLYGARVGNGISFSERGELSALLQLTVSEFAYEPYDEILGGVIYHIFVDRFNRGGAVEIPDTARMIDGEWSVIPEYPAYPGAHLSNNTFYGGTIYGIIDKLDYISSLGTRAIYLSPVFTSVSNHKYDTADYMHTDPMFGGDKALAELIYECKKRNIGIILDGVFNHTGDDSIYFNRRARFPELGAYQSKESKYYSWYDFKSFPDKYTCWWDIEILPRINPDNPECAEYFVGEGGVVEKYSEMGISGLRLDVADELSDGFIEKIKSTLSKNRPSILYGEVWEDASNKIAYSQRKKYYLGTELDGVMNYPLRTGIIEYILGRGTAALEYAIEVMANAPERVLHRQMNLLGTHDTERILTVLGGVSAAGKTNDELSVIRMSGYERERAVSRLISAYTVLATLPGIPAIFYGDEAGLEGYSDPFNRMPYPWGRESERLLSHYKAIGALRIENSVYKLGKLEVRQLTDKLFIFSRIDKGSEYVTVMNNSDNTIKLRFSAVASDMLGSVRSCEHSLPAGRAGVYKIKRNTKIETF